MNGYERVMMVKAMDFIIRQVNNEILLEDWLAIGVADGDIPYGDFDGGLDEVERLEFYLKDKVFKLLMKVFLNTMYEAWKDGGFFINGIGSGDMYE